MATDKQAQATTVEEQSRFERGLALLKQVNGSAGENVVASLGDLGRYIAEGFGDIYGREGLGLRDRELITVVLLAGLGGREPQLRVHIGGALNVGLTPKELEEAIIQTAFYAGFPAAINAMNLLHSILAERETASNQGKD